jgi:hypothetical protein
VEWLRAVVRGYFQYHALPGNWARLRAFRKQVWWLCGASYGVGVNAAAGPGRAFRNAWKSCCRRSEFCIPTRMFVSTPSIRGKNRVR